MRQRDLGISSIGETRERFADFSGTTMFSPKKSFTPGKKHKSCRTILSLQEEGGAGDAGLSPGLVVVVAMGTERRGNRLAAGLRERGGPQSPGPGSRCP